MPLSALLHPLLVAFAYPLMFIGLGLMVYLWKLPQAEVRDESETTQQINTRGAIYVSSSWKTERLKPYKVAVREEPVDRHPIFDELESKMRARLTAYEVLSEIGRKEKLKQLQLA